MYATLCGCYCLELCISGRQVQQCINKEIKATQFQQVETCLFPFGRPMSSV
ncbi:unnamed protein product [Ixodes persulcatus]